MPDEIAGAAGAIPRGHDCQSKSDFTELLRWWFETTDEATIGDVGTFGGKPWLWVQTGSQRCHLNADTRRDGVRKYLKMVAREHGKLTWHAVANNRRAVNKVVFGADMQPVKYFYLYTDGDLASPTEI